VPLPAEEPNAEPTPHLRVESTPGSEHGLVLRGAGEPEQVDEHTVRVPVTLEDDQGRRIGLALTVRLETLDSDPGS
jgi:hypothetical protein